MVKKESSPNLTQSLRRSPLSRRTRGEGKFFFHGPHPLSGIVLPLPGGGELFLMMDSATSPSAPRRMTALVEMSENQMIILGGFNPVLVE